MTVYKWFDIKWSDMLLLWCPARLFVFIEETRNKTCLCPRQIFPGSPNARILCPSLVWMNPFPAVSWIRTPGDAISSPSPCTCPAVSTRPVTTQSCCQVKHESPSLVTCRKKRCSHAHPNSPVYPWWCPGGWQEQITYQRHLQNLLQMYRMLRNNGFHKDHIKSFFAGNGRAPGEKFTGSY